jgi:hypothetical protein
VSYQYRNMNILIVICIPDAVLISIANADLRLRFLSDSFFLLAAAGASSDAIEIIIEASAEAVASFVIKSFFILVFDLLEAGNVSKIKV